MADKLDVAFAQAAKLIFGRALGPLARYEKWLRSRLPAGKNVKSCFGKGEAYVPDYGAIRYMPHDRVVSEEDAAIAVGKRIAREEDASSLDAIVANLPSIAYFVPTYAEGRNLEVRKSFLYLNCMNISDCFDPFASKNCAYVFSIMDCDSLFGAYRTKNAGFSIHTYNAYEIQRCFEIDGAKNCRDCYFCHNVEDLQDCIFCFNTKGKRYAIGNLEVGRESYLEFKQKLLAWMAPHLEREGGLPFDIYDVLCWKKREQHAGSA
ncbi:MAG: hypothetical protein N3F07_03780 [Candidatus Micrarchaeota archaeon]|nr:hypothetical protein [Candidatus Micrarchaeota archaeon]